MSFYHTIRKIVTWYGLMTVAVLSLALPAGAQQTESRVVGRLVDQSNAALPGVTVTVTSKQTSAQRTVVSSEDGSYAVTNLGPGTYTVQFELSGFATQTRDVTLGVGQIETADITMGVASFSEAVSVSAMAPVLDLSSAKIGVNVSPEEVANLPVNGRNFANLMTLATGATSDGNGGWASVRFNGKSNQQNYLNYDGVDGTYVFDSSPGYLNVTGSQFRLQTSMESVAEFRVNSGLAPAESGLGAGGNITVVSKSGSNRFSGSVFEYKRDDALDAASKYDDKKQELKLDQFGGCSGHSTARSAWARHVRRRSPSAICSDSLSAVSSLAFLRSAKAVPGWSPTSDHPFFRQKEQLVFRSNSNGVRSRGRSRDQGDRSGARPRLLSHNVCVRERCAARL